MDTMIDDGPVLVDVPLGSPTRPRWRGRVHLLALWAAVPALVVLVLLADGARARTGAIFYGVGLCAMLAVSVTYHRWVHTLRARARWRRADHATIYLLIAGTYTAISLAVVRGPWGMVVLAAGLVPRRHRCRPEDLRLPPRPHGRHRAVPGARLDRPRRPPRAAAGGPDLAGLAAVRRRSLLHGRRRGVRQAVAPTAPVRVLVPRGLARLHAAGHDRPLHGDLVPDDLTRPAGPGTGSSEFHSLWEGARSVRNSTGAAAVAPSDRLVSEPYIVLKGHMRSRPLPPSFHRSRRRTGASTDAARPPTAATRGHDRGPDGRARPVDGTIDGGVDDGGGRRADAAKAA